MDTESERMEDYVSSNWKPKKKVGESVLTFDKIDFTSNFLEEIRKLTTTLLDIKRQI
jgi:hypothetical protein